MAINKNKQKHWFGCLATNIFASSLFITKPVLSEPLESLSRTNEARPYEHIRFFKSTKISEQGVAKVLYQTLDSPSKVTKQLLTGALAKGLDSLDMLDSIEGTVKYVKENTEFDFGQCGEFKLRKQLRAATCIKGFGSLQLKSDYDLDEVSIEFEWRF